MSEQRILFAKYGTAKYISHLDLMHTMGAGFPAGRYCHSAYDRVSSPSLCVHPAPASPGILQPM